MASDGNNQACNIGIARCAAWKARGWPVPHLPCLARRRGNVSSGLGRDPPGDSRPVWSSSSQGFFSRCSLQYKHFNVLGTRPSRAPTDLPMPSFQRPPPMAWKIGPASDACRPPPCPTQPRPEPPDTDLLAICTGMDVFHELRRPRSGALPVDPGDGANSGARAITRKRPFATVVQHIICGSSLRATCFYKPSIFCYSKSVCDR